MGRGGHRPALGGSAARVSRGPGYSERNIRSARAFYVAYAAGRSASDGASPAPLASPTATRQQPVAESGVGSSLGSSPSSSPVPLAALPWGHDLLLLEKLAEPTLRLWSAEQATQRGWSRSVLGLQIETRLHERVIRERTLASPPRGRAAAWADGRS